MHCIFSQHTREGDRGGRGLWSPTLPKSLRQVVKNLLTLKYHTSIFQNYSYVLNNFEIIFFAFQWGTAHNMQLCLLGPGELGHSGARWQQSILAATSKNNCNMQACSLII